MLKLILRLLKRPVGPYRSHSAPCEPPAALSLRELADIPAFHPRQKSD